MGKKILNVDCLCFSLLLGGFLFLVEIESPGLLLYQFRLFGKQMSLEDRKVGFKLDGAKLLVITCQRGQMLIQLKSNRAFDLPTVSNASQSS